MSVRGYGEHCEWLAGYGVESGELRDYGPPEPDEEDEEEVESGEHIHNE